MSADWIVAIATVVLIGVTAFYAYQTRVLNGHTARAAGAAENAATHAQDSVTISRDAAESARQSAEQARLSVDVAREEVNELRAARVQGSQPLVVALIGSQSWSGSYQQGWTFDVVLENVGTGPALDVKLQAFAGGQPLPRLHDGLASHWYLRPGTLSEPSRFSIPEGHPIVLNPSDSVFDRFLVTYEDIYEGRFELVFPLRIDTAGHIVSVTGAPRRKRFIDLRTS